MGIPSSSLSKTPQPRRSRLPGFQWRYLHAIVNADLLTDQRPLKLHLVLRLVAEAERDPDRRAT